EQKFGKSIHDAGWNRFANFLAYKAEGAGCRVEFVNPRNTTKECSRCGAVVEKMLSERTHNCPFCGLCIDRDINAARNILKRATVGTTGSNASGGETVVSSRKEEAARFIGW
ncbi:MAG: transposase, partial [Candidatus Micrarchaeota archaeon]